MTPEPPAVLDEFAPGVSLGAHDGELGLKLGINRLVAEDRLQRGCARRRLTEDVVRHHCNHRAAPGWR